MRIVVLFQFQDEPTPAASTGVEGAVTDFILPCKGDLVRHRDFSGTPVLGRVQERIYLYDIASGVDVEGTVSVTVVLDKVAVH